MKSIQNEKNTKKHKKRFCNLYANFLIKLLSMMKYVLLDLYLLSLLIVCSIKYLTYIDTFYALLTHWSF